MSTFSRRPMGKDRRSIVRFLRARDGHNCMLCGLPLNGGSVASLTKKGQMKMTIDHKVPKSRGGSDALSNLQLAHYQCNHNKGNEMPQPVEGFPDLLEYQRYSDKQFREQKAEEERQQKITMLRAEREFLVSSVLEIDRQIESLANLFSAPPKKKEPVSIAQYKSSGVYAPDEVILTYLKGMKGAKYEQISEYVVRLGFKPLRKHWMLSLLYKDLIYKEGNTRAAFWYASRLPVPCLPETDRASS